MTFPLLLIEGMRIKARPLPVVSGEGLVRLFNYEPAVATATRLVQEEMAKDLTKRPRG